MDGRTDGRTTPSLELRVRIYEACYRLSYGQRDILTAPDRATYTDKRKDSKIQKMSYKSIILYSMFALKSLPQFQLELSCTDFR